HDGQRHAPGGGIAGSFDDRSRSALIVGESPYSGDNILHLVNVDGSDRAETFGHIERGGAPSQGDDPGATARQHADEFQPDRPAANHRDNVAGAHLHFVNAPQNAGKRLRQRRALSSTECGTPSMFSMAMRPGMRM